MFVALVAIALVVFACTVFWLRSRHAGHRRRRRRRRPGAGPSHRALTPPKPAWVRREILRLKALLPDHGCRKIAQVFNHLHRRRGETVGKTFVANVLRRHGHEVLRLRRKLKHRLPRTVARNVLWALDLTSLPDPHGSRTVLGVLDHGSRACLVLRELRSRSAITLLRALLDAIERFGRPRVLRTDNEAAFTSRLFRAALLALGIRHRRTAPIGALAERTYRKIFRHLQKPHPAVVGERRNPRRPRSRPRILPRLVQPRAPPPAPRRTHPGSGLGRQGVHRPTTIRLGVEWAAHRIPLATVAGTGGGDAIRRLPTVHGAATLAGRSERLNPQERR